jgi:ligand-binding sensor domain-containing protein
MRSFIYSVTTLIFGIIFCSCGKEVSVTPPDTPPPNGFIYIDSNPKGFDIYLDGKDRRRLTPDSLNWLSTGTYKITLKKTLFRDSTFTINVTEGKKKSIYIDFSKNPLMLGSIFCNSNPEGALIYINDISTGQFTPSTVKNILPGDYQVKYHLKNYQDVSFNISVSSGSSPDLVGTLIDATLWSYYNTNNSAIKTDDLTCVAVDRNDVVWIGTENLGVLNFDGAAWGGTDLYPLLPDKHINCITVYNNIKFIGTNAGFVTYDGATARTYGFKSSGLPDFRIEAIGFDAAGDWYIGSHAGLTRSYLINGNRYWSTYDSSDVPDYWITSILYDNSGTLWVGTHNQGIARRNSNYDWDRIFTNDSQLINNYIRAIARAPSGEIWVGFGTSTASGGVLASYDGASWQNYYVLKSTSQTYAILVDKNNTKWVATDQGLVKFTTGSTVLTLNYDNTGLNIDNPTGLAQDSKGNIWISTNGGGLIEYKGNY